MARGQSVPPLQTALHPGVTPSRAPAPRQNENSSNAMGWRRGCGGTSPVPLNCCVAKNTRFVILLRLFLAVVMGVCPPPVWTIPGFRGAEGRGGEVAPSFYISFRYIRLPSDPAQQSKCHGSAAPQGTSEKGSNGRPLGPQLDSNWRALSPLACPSTHCSSLLVLPSSRAAGM